MKKCWAEKDRKKDLYSIKREKFYNSNGWSTEAIIDLRREGKNVEKLVKIREQNIQRQIINCKIEEAKYNRQYKELDREKETPSYLLKRNWDKIITGDEIRAMIKVRCGNLEEANRYWMEEEDM